MPFKDALLALMTHPDPTPVSAIDDAVAVAAALGAHISAIACKVTIQVPGQILGNAILNVPAMAAAEARKSSTNAESLLAAFQETAEKCGVFRERILEECPTSEVSNVVIEHARVRDLTMVPMLEGDYVLQWLGEAVIFGSGHPTVLLPQARKRSGTFSLDTVIIAWDFSRPAARAVADSLPILEKAKRTCVVTVSNEKKFQTKRSGAELAKHLAQHGVDITLDVVDGAGRSIGDVLESYGASQDGDLLIMGAYGHSRFREFILGGATDNMLKRAPVPVFMSH